MKKIIINGLECIFDVDANTAKLTVSKRSSGRHVLIYQDSKKCINKLYSRLLLDAPDHLFVDHVNGNTLDNRKCNLRLATRQQNQCNSVLRKNKILPKGVSKHGKGYSARIMHNCIQHCLGTFPTVAEAETAYLKAAENLHGEFAFHLSREGAVS